MPTPYQPKEGQIFMCDFRGMIEPEMIKKRRVVIIHRHRKNRKLVTVVPLSTTTPDPVQWYHIKLSEEYAKEHFETDEVWIKCDMFYVLSTERLSLQKHTTKDRYVPEIEKELLKEIKEKIIQILR
jgi:uncharacterized protein YifN (PemK superfamily)